MRKLIAALMICGAFITGYAQDDGKQEAIEAEIAAAEVEAAVDADVDAEVAVSVEVSEDKDAE